MITHFHQKTVLLCPPTQVMNDTTGKVINMATNDFGLRSCINKKVPVLKSEVAFPSNSLHNHFNANGIDNNAVEHIYGIL
jgi:ABC-type taurine transport system ATPase subunit